VARGPSECGHADYPAVYTKVSAVRSWIMGICSSKNIPTGITKAEAMP
jgi:secreted trypsin-like serine protease